MSPSTLLIFFLVTIVHLEPVKTNGPKHDKIVVCYLASWAVYRHGRGAFSIEDMNPNLCTHIIYSFAGLNVKEHSIQSLDTWQDLTEDYGKGGYNRITNLKDHYSHLKVSVAIGGWNEGSSNYSALVKDPQRRAIFVENAVRFLKKHKFDGLDLDWEYPGKRGGSKDDKRNFLLLVKELKQAFKKYQFLLTAAFGAAQDTIDIAYDVKGLSVYLDFIHMMCYDYHGSWDKRTGANAPLHSLDNLSVEFTINYMLKLGAPPEKLVMGIPMYGRTFTLTKKYEPDEIPKLGDPADVGFKGSLINEEGFMGYNEICLETRNSPGWTLHWDSESKTPFAVRIQQFISYDDKKSIEEKVRFAILEKKLAGVMIWSIDTDDFHGDCSPDGTFVNYPLLKQIDIAVLKAERELEKRKRDEETDEENVIHGKEPHTANHSSCVFSFIFLSILLISSVTLVV